MMGGQAVLKAVLFDLDGTLLPMDQDVFVRDYFGRLAKYLAPHGYEPKALIDAVWEGTMAMVKNCGEATNEWVFWDKFCQIFGQQAADDEPLFASFYENWFDKVQTVCGYTPEAAQTVHWIKEQGLRVSLATNPIFPAIATRKRIGWAGLRPEDFESYTTYENCRFCKPDPAYYREIVKHMGLKPEECLMVGNDVGDDMVARSLGMDVFLLTDCLINKDHEDILQYPHGSFSQLVSYIKEKL